MAFVWLCTKIPGCWQWVFSHRAVVKARQKAVFAGKTKHWFYRYLDWAEAESRAGREGSSNSWFLAAVEIILFLLCALWLA